MAGREDKPKNMVIFNRSIPRRSVLRGLGASLALPLLDGMVPVFGATPNTPTRLAFIFVPNGRIPSQWTPAAEGAAFEFTPTLAPLAPFREELLVLSGLSSKAAEPRKGDTPGPHARAGAAFLTGIHVKPGQQLGISVDQVAAKEFGKHTQLASLELSLESGETGDGADGADSDAYINTVSWRSETTPLPVENNPRAVFERLFGDGGSSDAAARLRRLRQDRSILDFVSQDVARVVKDIGSSDRAKLTEYLDGIRDVERRIQRMEELSSSSAQLPVVERPAGVPPKYDDYAKLMFDLQVLAFQSDQTRVITFSMGREKSERAYPEIGISEPHHALSHHSGDTAMIAKVNQIEILQSKLFAYYLEKLRAMPDGDGTLLDHTIITFGSSLSDGMAHSPLDLPIVIAGGGGAGLKGGRHIRYRKDTPLANLFLRLLDTTGVPVDHFGDSTGELELLSVA